MSEASSNEVATKPKPRFNKPGGNNPNGKGGFSERPEDRNPGHWDSKNVISFQYQKMLRMDAEELKMYMKADKVTMAMRIAFNMVRESEKSLPHAKELTDRTEGKAMQPTDITSAGEALQPVLVRFMDADRDTDTEGV